MGRCWGCTNGHCPTHSVDGPGGGPCPGTPQGRELGAVPGGRLRTLGWGSEGTEGLGRGGPAGESEALGSHRSGRAESQGGRGMASQPPGTAWWQGAPRSRRCSFLPVWGRRAEVGGAGARASQAGFDVQRLPCSEKGRGQEPEVPCGRGAPTPKSS